MIKRHLPRIAVLLLGALFIFIVAAPAWSQQGPPPINFDSENFPMLEGRKAKLSDMLDVISGGPDQYQIVGTQDPLINGKIAAYTIDQAMRQLETMLPDLLIVREADKFVVYTPDEKTRKIVYMYTCRESRAADLAKVISKQDVAVGFTAANQLVGDGKGNLGQHTAVSLGGTGGKGGLLPADVTYHVISYQNAIMLTGPAKDVRTALKVIKRIDREIPSVLIEILIVQYFHDDQFTWRYNLTDGAVLKADPPTFSSGVTQPGTIAGPNTFGPQPWGIDFQNLAFNPATGAASLAYSGIGSLTSQFKQNLTFLASENLARVVTNPHIAVINGQTGQVLLNEKFNFVNSVVTANGTVSQKADSLSSLTAINVTPTVLGPGRVHLAVNTTLTTFGSTSDVSSTLPGQRINELGTSVVLPTGDSLILGGLVKEEANEARDKIPGVAKIPVLGHLFRGRDDLRRFSETVVYVIPHVSAPQPYEDEYLEEIFNQSRRLKERGEIIRSEHRQDRTESDRLYHYKEQLDHIEHHNLHQELHPRRKWFHPFEVIPSGSPEMIEATETMKFEHVPPVTEKPQESTHGPLLVAPMAVRPTSPTTRIARWGGHPNASQPSFNASTQDVTADAPNRVLRRLPPLQADRAYGSENHAIRASYHEAAGQR